MDSPWISLPSFALPTLVTTYCFLGEHLHACPSVWLVHTETAPHSGPRAGHTAQTRSSGAQQSLVARWVQGGVPGSLVLWGITLSLLLKLLRKGAPCLPVLLWCWGHGKRSPICGRELLPERYLGKHNGEVTETWVSEQFWCPSSQTQCDQAHSVTEPINSLSYSSWFQ